MVERSKEQEFRTDCRYFPVDRPCRFHKQDGRLCKDSKDYSPVRKRILIIKLGAMGDVLRTTAILPAVKRKYPRSQVTWVVLRESRELLENIPEIDRILAGDWTVTPTLQVESFDLVLSLDLSQEGGALASLTRAKKKMGFGLTRDGRVLPLNRGAEYWFRTSHRDDLKRANTRTMQEIMHEAAGLDPAEQRIMVNLTEDERRFAAEFARRVGLKRDRPVVGINPGGGHRWPTKRWTVEGYCELVSRLVAELGVHVLLYGGVGDEPVTQLVLDRCGTSVIDTGSHNTVREFTALLGLCDCIVTGDTLALHAALGLGKKVVAMFGPTSSSEIDMYGRGVKLRGEVECLCCYLPSCKRKPTCMELLKPEKVLGAVRSLIG